MGLKYFSRLKIYKNYSGTNRFNPETFKAYSYEWWCFVMKHPTLGIIFNDFSYSVTTRKHQSQMRTLLRNLGHEIAFTIEAPKGLQDLKSALEYAESRLTNARAELVKPKRHKRLDVERQAKVDAIQKEICIILELMK